jgi:hypothetical protein
MDGTIEELRKVPLDENGIELSLIDYCRSLTAAQRL